MPGSEMSVGVCYDGLCIGWCLRSSCLLLSCLCIWICRLRRLPVLDLCFCTVSVCTVTHVLLLLCLPHDHQALQQLGLPVGSPCVTLDGLERVGLPLKHNGVCIAWQVRVDVAVLWCWCWWLAVTKGWLMKEASMHHHPVLLY